MKTTRPATRRLYVFGVKCGHARIVAQLTQSGGERTSWSALIKRSGMRHGVFLPSQRIVMHIKRVLSQLLKICKVHGSVSMTASGVTILKRCSMCASLNNTHPGDTICIFCSTVVRYTTLTISSSRVLLTNTVILNVSGSVILWRHWGRVGGSMSVGYGRIAPKRPM